MIRENLDILEQKKEGGDIGCGVGEFCVRSRFVTFCIAQKVTKNASLSKNSLLQAAFFLAFWFAFSLIQFSNSVSTH
jgi:hypothetical protein